MKRVPSWTATTGSHWASVVMPSRSTPAALLRGELDGAFEADGRGLAGGERLGQGDDEGGLVIGGVGKADGGVREGFAVELVDGGIFDGHGGAVVGHALARRDAEDFQHLGEQADVLAGIL